MIKMASSEANIYWRKHTTVIVAVNTNEAIHIRTVFPVEPQNIGMMKQRHDVTF